jgi:L-asparagine oxygenase
VFADLPINVLRAIFDYGNDPRVYGALLLQNFPIDDNIPQTPIDGHPSTSKQTFISEACVLGISKLLGQPFAYCDEKEGDIIQALCPVMKEASAPSSESFEVELGFHTDFSFDKNNPNRPYNVLNPDYIILFCLRADRDGGGHTLYADARDICKRLSYDQIELMRKPLFQFAASYSFTGRLNFQKSAQISCVVYEVLPMRRIAF